MAAPMAGRLAALGRRLAPPARAWLPGLTQVRWSRYGPSYLEPEVNKEVYRKPLEGLSEEEKTEWELKTLQPIKATPSNVTSSVFSDPTISKFTNMIMKGGNKVLARSIVTQTLEAIKRKQIEKYHQASEEERESIECNPYIIFHQALKNCQPIIGLCNVQKGGKTYQVRVFADRSGENLAPRTAAVEAGKAGAQAWNANARWASFMQPPLHQESALRDPSWQDQAENPSCCSYFSASLGCAIGADGKGT
ncbi:28S ribosomal protein S7, mitochondrial isoform X1 [Gopherus flavomarginatus]|uniref:28S ribosomal protein S7, mitochondrial isoform X1 n=1 Tax=Gopherus flavomarginatus TaxID=286002 RepID=UPI0021CC4982|nr:28S ribosomal protein S7, mitochondrial isoform X1 [Gopherus flavomarginatus]